MWEKYCLHRCFVVPEGFSLPKADKSDGTLMDVDVLLDADLDVQLDSLREKLFWADKEATKLQRELQLLEKQSVLSDKRAEYVNEAVQLFEENSLPDMFQEMQKTAAELREKIENFRVKRTSEIRQDKIERMHDLNGHTFMHKRKGFYLTEFEGVLAFVADMKSI
ncbi:hypothetical protein Syun_027567 [Stephania yunnanensis]|uniref:Uncharacterized protein n=1 Tax=Stephania yunnanensis TaxID=152371 RepID=A0AAP0HQB9_9MAGN